MNDAGRGHPREGLSDYLDDELTVEVRAGIDRHLAECEDCRTELEALRRLKRAVADERVPPVPLDLQARIGRSLDAAKGARPPRHFVIPTTIAATIAALGILVALQWREGRLATPPAPEPKAKEEARDELRRQNVPLLQPPLAPEPGRVPQDKKLGKPSEEQHESARRDALEKDLNAAPAPILEPSDKQKTGEGAQRSRRSEPSASIAPSPPSLPGAPRAMGADTKVDAARERAASVVAAAAPNGVAGGVVGGVVGGVEGGVLGRASPCAERWSDSGLRGRWEVPDVEAAARELGQVAIEVGGSSEWRGAADGRPYVLIVPRDRFDEVFYALRARGIAGLDVLVSLADVTGCPGITVTLTATATAPTPR
jgi:hypothetical protein